MFYCSKSLICIKGQGDIEPVPMYLSSASLVSDKQLCAYRFPFHLTGLILLLLFYMFRIFFIYLFLTVLGLHCVLLVVVSRGSSLIAVLGFLTAAASPVHRLQGMQASIGEAHPGSREQAQQWWVTGLVTGLHGGSSQIRDRTRVSCTG